MSIGIPMVCCCPQTIPVSRLTSHKHHQTATTKNKNKTSNSNEYNNDNNNQQQPSTVSHQHLFPHQSKFVIYPFITIEIAVVCIIFHYYSYLLHCL